MSDQQAPVTRSDSTTPETSRLSEDEIIWKGISEKLGASEYPKTETVTVPTFSEKGMETLTAGMEPAEAKTVTRFFELCHGYLNGSAILDKFGSDHDARRTARAAIQSDPDQARVYVERYEGPNQLRANNMGALYSYAEVISDVLRTHDQDGLADAIGAITPPDELRLIDPDDPHRGTPYDNMEDDADKIAVVEKVERDAISAFDAAAAYIDPVDITYKEIEITKLLPPEEGSHE